MENTSFGLVLLVAAGYTFNWITTIIDAVVSAKEINHEILKQKYKSGYNRFNFGLRLDKNRHPNLMFGLSL